MGEQNHGILPAYERRGREVYLMAIGQNDKRGLQRPGTAESDFNELQYSIEQYLNNEVETAWIGRVDGCSTEHSRYQESESPDLELPGHNGESVRRTRCWVHR